MIVRPTNVKLKVHIKDVVFEKVELPQSEIYDSLTIKFFFIFFLTII